MQQPLEGRFRQLPLSYKWPKEFTSRRRFNIEAENRAYIQFVRDNLFDDHWGRHHDEESQTEVRDKYADVDEGEDNDEDDVVSLFMSVERDELDYHDQAVRVKEFCKGTHLRDLDQHHDLVALLDDRNQYRCRANLALLTAKELYQKLQEKRFTSCSSKSENYSHEIDADRRLIYIENLDPLTISVLAATASSSQARALRNLFYKHLTFESSIGVTISTRGFRNFSFHCYIPYYALRTSTKLFEDPRKGLDGTPLRRSHILPSMDTLIPSTKVGDKIECLYETQISIAITGVDQWRWIAWGFADTYFEAIDTLTVYEDMTNDFAQPDPLTAGIYDARCPISTPREYFLTVLEVRLRQVRREWDHIVRRLQETVRDKRINDKPYLSSLKVLNIEETNERAREFSHWNTQIIYLTRQVKNCLSSTIAACDSFCMGDICYFREQEEDNSQIESNILARKRLAQLQAIDKTISDMRSLELMLKFLIEELDGAANALNTYLSIENNLRGGALSQQRTAEYVKVLTMLVIIVFAPISLASSLLSTHQGVLPFAPNFKSLVFFALTFTSLAIASLALLNWKLWTMHLVSFMNWVRAELVFGVETRGVKENKKGTGGEIDDGYLKTRWSTTLASGYVSELLGRTRRSRSPDLEKAYSI